MGRVREERISIHALREEGDFACAACIIKCENFYPRPPRGGRPPQCPGITSGNTISIHALREEGDPRGPRKESQNPEISIHALREEGDQDFLVGMGDTLKFLSTPSARRATAGGLRQDRGPADFYPRPPRGGRPLFLLNCQSCLYFYPRPPRGGRPESLRHEQMGHYISIHALREEGDPLRLFLRRDELISIHALREEGDSKNRDKISIFKQIIQHSARI